MGGDVSALRGCALCERWVYDGEEGEHGYGRCMSDNLRPATIGDIRRIVREELECIRLNTPSSNNP